MEPDPTAPLQAQLDPTTDYKRTATAGSTVTKSQKDIAAATAKIKKSSHMTAATRSNTMGEKLYNKGWEKWRRVCCKLDDKHINIMETTNIITYKHVDNLAAADSDTILKTGQKWNQTQPLHYKPN